MGVGGVRERTQQQCGGRGTRSHPRTHVSLVRLPQRYETLVDTKIGYYWRKIANWAGEVAEELRSARCAPTTSCPALFPASPPAGHSFYYH